MTSFKLDNLIKPSPNKVTSLGSENQDFGRGGDTVQLITPLNPLSKYHLQHTCWEMLLRPPRSHSVSVVPRCHLQNTHRVTGMLLKILDSWVSPPQIEIH